MYPGRDARRYGLGGLHTARVYVSVDLVPIKRSPSPTGHIDRIDSRPTRRISELLHFHQDWSRRPMTNHSMGVSIVRRGDHSGSNKDTATNITSTSQLYLQRAFASEAEASGPR